LVAVLPVEVAVVYSYQELFGTAEVTYIFPGGRTFLLEDGQQIENDNLKPGMRIQLGDRAIGTVQDVQLIYDPPDPPVFTPDGKVVGRVVGTIRHIGVETINVSWPGYTATNSPDHPYYSASRGDYVPAKDLKVGEFLLTDENAVVPVLAVTKPKFERTDLYNLEVEHFHNYFVGHPGGHAVLVHNGVNPVACINTPTQVAKELAEYPIPKGGMSIQDLQAQLPAINAERAKIGLKPLKIREDALAKPNEWYYDLSKSQAYQRPAPPVDLSKAGLTREIPCFPAGAKVAVPGGNIAIEQIRAGADVYAFDEQSGRVVVRTVTQVLHGRTNRLIDVSLGENVLSATAKHRFWEGQSRKWTDARDLEAGMTVQNLDLSNNRITAVSMRGVPEQTTFNLTVDGCHNYFIGEPGVLVHNGGEPTYKVYFGYAPTDTTFSNPIYVGLTDQTIPAREGQHRAQALKNPEKYGFKQDIVLRAQIDGLTLEQAQYHEAALYHKMAGQGHKWGNLQAPMTEENMKALAALRC
jgi:hypothetical protein